MFQANKASRQTGQVKWGEGEGLPGHLLEGYVSALVICIASACFKVPAKRIARYVHPPYPMHLPSLAIDIFPFSSFIFLAATAHLAAVCLIYAICHVLYLFLSTFYEVNNLNFCSARLWSGDRSVFTLPAWPGPICTLIASIFNVWAVLIAPHARPAPARPLYFVH